MNGWTNPSLFLFLTSAIECKLNWLDLNWTELIFWSVSEWVIFLEGRELDGLWSCTVFKISLTHSIRVSSSFIPPFPPSSSSPLSLSSSLSGGFSQLSKYSSRGQQNESLRSLRESSLVYRLDSIEREGKVRESKGGGGWKGAESDGRG